MTVQIGGIPQSMIIQTVDPANPVLLCVHGAPGMTECFLEQDHPTGLERHFTMVWWDQRGAGMSLSTDVRPETMAMDQMIADTIEAADLRMPSSYHAGLTKFPHEICATVPP